jgi:hypothetical protein
MIDEPGAFNDEQRAHASACGRCGARVVAIKTDAQYAERVMSGRFDADVARGYARVRHRAATARAGSIWYRPAAALATAAAIVVVLLFTPLGGLANSLLTIFEPQQFQPIAVSRADLQDLHLLPQADDVGTQRVLSKPQKQYYDSIAQAQSHASFRLLQPSLLPPQFGQVRTFTLLTPAQMTFTFSAAKAQAFERRSHKLLPPMPPSLDGTVVRLQTGYVFNAHYEASSRAPVRTKGTPFFELIEAEAPRVTSTGASLPALEQYLLAMPNVSPQLAQQIRALGDIQNTVPVPVVIDKQTARRVAVQGTSGLAIGDNTGLGAGVMWEKNGIVYVVGGPLTMDQVMIVANGLR